MALQSDAAAQEVSDYIVGPQDVVTITVWDQPDLSGKFSIEADGTFVFPMVGRIRGGGLTLREVEATLKQRLAEGYFKNPQLSVAVEQYRSQRIFVVGEVRSPGMYALTGEMTLIEALARAGSTSAAAGEEALVVRAGKSATAPLLPEEAQGAEVVRVDLAELQSVSLAQNVRLRDGDTIFVPKAATFYVFGQVKDPGEFPLRKNTTVLQALSVAGGVLARGSIGRIKIVRLAKGYKVELKAKLGDAIRPGDTIMVPERFF